MDEIKDIVNRIVKGCSTAGVQVSEVLAAYVARTVSYVVFCWECLSYDYYSSRFVCFRLSKKMSLILFLIVK